ncbi:MAG: hypothetical protein EI684_17390, partial [Candidatus Viridilinea halotolerans]
MSPPASPQLRIPALILAMALLVVGSLAMATLAPPPPAAARITNPPNGPAASVVDCIRSGPSINPALPSHFSPRFAMACMAGAWSRQSYEFDNQTGDGDASRYFPTIVEFGASANGLTGQRTLASAGSGGTVAGSVSTGSIFGLAYSSGSNPNIPAALPLDMRRDHLFTAAYAKRITRFGIGGPGAIYLIDRVNQRARLYAQVAAVVPGPGTGQQVSAGWPSGFANIPGDGSAGQFINSGAPGVGDLDATPQMGGLHAMEHDEAIRGRIGTVGLGGLALSSDERFLAVVNLHRKTVVWFDTWSAASNPTANVFTPDPAVAGCLGGTDNFRPFALTYHPDDEGNDFAYLGYVCSAETPPLNRENLYAGVLRWQTGVGTASRVLHFRLDAFDGQRDVGRWKSTDGWRTQWMPWQDRLRHPGVSANYHQPMLTSIAFAEDGSML